MSAASDQLPRTWPPRGQVCNWLLWEARGLEDESEMKTTPEMFPEVFNTVLLQHDVIRETAGPNQYGNLCTNICNCEHKIQYEVSKCNECMLDAQGNHSDCARAFQTLEHGDIIELDNKFGVSFPETVGGVIQSRHALLCGFGGVRVSGCM